MSLKHRQYAALVALILFIALLLVIAANYIHYERQQSLIHSAEKEQQIALETLGQLAQEGLLNENYALIEWFFHRWGESNSDIVALSISNASGFALANYQRPKPATIPTLKDAKTITVSGNPFHLAIATELRFAHESLQQFYRQQLSVALLLLTTLSFGIWLIFQRLAIRPLFIEIKQRHLAEQAVQQQHDYLQKIVNGIPDGLMVINTDYQIELYNNAVRDNTPPLNSQQMRYCYQISHHRNTPCDGNEHPCPLQQVITTGKAATVIHNHPDANGNNRFFELLASPIFAENGKLVGIIESSHELTRHIQLQHELEEKRQHFDHLAHHDPLTGLNNRLAFVNHLEQAILRGLTQNSGFSLLFIDLDQFKQINDTMGHSVGDAVLLETSHRLKTSLRSNDSVARLGGDEFTIILEATNNCLEIGAIVEKIIAVIRQPMAIGGQQYHITPSIGISLFPNDGSDAETLIRNADTAMYRVKDRGRNGYDFYTKELTLLARSRIDTQSGIRKALLQHQFVCFYQPQFDIASGQLVGMEALVRWIDPLRGLVPPNEFIPLAEENGQIIELGEEVLNMAIAQTVAWRNSGLNPGKVAVNLSGKQLIIGNIAQTIEALMARHQCQIEWIDLEITESFVMGQDHGSLDRLRELHELGLHLAIDDFGTGYSSLSYLKQLPIHKLKIDQSFVKGLPLDTDNVGITRAIIALANSLGLEVIAEGVETKEQAKFLKREGCPTAQGYLYARPLPASEITLLLQQNANHPAA
ncbi:MAG: EAL domain-containing protein [Gammaproteobacteria bacterium]|nr:EAL domain-containing protein [Gammaproteobacteria bacterium]